MLKIILNILRFSWWLGVGSYQLCYTSNSCSHIGYNQMEFKHRTENVQTCDDGNTRTLNLNDAIQSMWKRLYGHLIDEEQIEWYRKHSVQIRWQDGIYFGICWRKPRFGDAALQLWSSCAPQSSMKIVEILRLAQNMISNRRQELSNKSIEPWEEASASAARNLNSSANPRFRIPNFPHNEHSHDFIEMRWITNIRTRSELLSLDILDNSYVESGNSPTSTDAPPSEMNCGAFNAGEISNLSIKPRLPSKHYRVCWHCCPWNIIPIIPLEGKMHHMCFWTNGFFWCRFSYR